MLQRKKIVTVKIYRKEEAAACMAETKHKGGSYPYANSNW